MAAKAANAKVTGGLRIRVIRGIGVEQLGIVRAAYYSPRG